MLCNRARGSLCVLAMGFLILGMTGCGVFGARVMRNSHAEYNTALQQSEEEQLLANLVRMRYAQSPSFLNIDGITTQLSLSAEPTPEKVPEYQQFEEILDLMRGLERRKLLEFVFESYNDTTEIVLALQKKAWRTPEANRLAKLLNIVPGQTHYDFAYRSIRPEVKEGPKHTIMLETRSFLGVLFFLSQNVQVPEEDLKKGIVRVTRTEGGAPFDWSKILENTFIVKSSQMPPPSAAVAAKYRGSWFYIEDNDTNSKITLMLVSQLLALQSHRGEAVTPILTLPAGR